jgi:hypothetical protein
MNGFMVIPFAGGFLSSGFPVIKVSTPRPSVTSPRASPLRQLTGQVRNST